MSEIEKFGDYGTNIPFTPEEQKEENEEGVIPQEKVTE